MKKHKFKIIIIISIILIILLLIYMLQKYKFSSPENIFLFNLYSSQDDTSNYKYVFNLNKENPKIVNINLYDTLKGKTLLNEKIASGAQGEFDIIISSASSSSDFEYKVIFESKNTKPQNLLFSVKGSDKKYSNIKELEKDLVGYIKKDSAKKITIQWEWKYENGAKQNIQDTLDGQNIKTYNFDINILGQAI